VFARRLRARSVLLWLGLSVGCGDSPYQSYASLHRAPFEIEEATIASIQRGFARGKLTATELLDAYLARIARYDEAGPTFNAVLALNPGARARARDLDAQYAATGKFVGPLHGIPVIVKDNLDT
jgi:amidase